VRAVAASIPSSNFSVIPIFVMVSVLLIVSGGRESNRRLNFTEMPTLAQKVSFIGVLSQKKETFN
jgi:hypothetical protein